MGLRAGLDRCGKSRPHRDSIPGLSSPLAVAMQTTIPGPHHILILPHISITVIAFLHYCEEINSIDSTYSEFVKYILKVSHCRFFCNCLLMNNST